MLKLGITGGIATGKTEVMKIFAALQVPTIDADKLAHELLSNDPEIKDAVLQRYGPGILDDERNINRQSLREIIFNNSNEKEFLEKLLHPLIIKKLQEFSDNFSNEKNAPYIILVIPLLFETNCQAIVDKILVIDTSFETQIDRLTKRDALNLQQVMNIINHQMDREQRLQSADYIIFNNNDLNQLQQDVVKLDGELRFLKTS